MMRIYFDESAKKRPWILYVKNIVTKTNDRIGSYGTKKEAENAFLKLFCKPCPITPEDIRSVKNPLSEF